MVQPVVQKTRRQIIQGAAAAVGAMSVAPGLMAQAAPVRVGYAIARTGPWTGGAQVSQEPNYLLWAEEQNNAGGLDVKGVKRKIELISSDDRSDTETVVRTYEKLMGSDKVDLILPPWGSGANFAIAPLANRFGYPLLAPTALSRKLIDMNLPYFFSLLQQPDKMMGALVDMLVANGGSLDLEMTRDGRQDRLLVDGWLRLDAGSTVRLLFPGGAPDVDQTFALLSTGQGPASLGGARVLVGDAALGWTQYGQDNGRTLALAFQDDTAQRLDATTAWDRWIVDPGQTHYADSDLGRRGSVDVAGTLGLRASAALELDRAVTAPGGRLLNSGSLFVSASLDNGGEVINRGRLTAIHLDNHGAFTNRGELALGWPGDPAARFGEDGYEGYWRSLRANGVKVAKGWTEAYYTDFSRNGGKRPLVVSYASSPAA